MAVTNFLQSIWSKHIMDSLELKVRLVPNCIRTYEGDCKYAKSVKILGAGEPTVSAYGKKPITIEEMSDEGQELQIDQANYFAFYVDDVDKAQSTPGLMEEYMRKATHKLAVARDRYVGLLYTEAPWVETACTIDTSDSSDAPEKAVKAQIDRGILMLRKNDFDEEGVIEITPTVYQYFKNYLITLSTDNEDYVKRGIVGMYDGFEVVMSNAIYDYGAEGMMCCVRGKKAVAFAGQINEVEALRAPDRFADIVRGLDAFGAKIIDRKRIAVIPFLIN